MPNIKKSKEITNNTFPISQSNRKFKFMVVKQNEVSILLHIFFQNFLHLNAGDLAIQDPSLGYHHQIQIVIY